MKAIERAAVLLLALAMAGCPKGPPEIQEPTEEELEEQERAEAEAAMAATPVEELVDDAVDFLEQDRDMAVSRAVPLLQAALDQDPDHAWATLNLGVAWARRGDLSRAQELMQRATRLEPELAETWLYLGALMEEGGRQAQALATYRTGLRHAPEHMPLRAAQVRMLRELGRIDDAIEAATEALAIRADDLEIYNQMGQAYMDRGDLDMAVFVFEKARLAHGADSHARILTNLGWARYLMDEEREAEDLLSRARELDPELVPAMVYMARIYLDARNYEDMVPLLEEAVDLAPEDTGALLNLGLAYRGMERYDDAVRKYERALEVDPADPAPWFNLGVLYGDYLKDYDESIEAFQRYVDSGGPEAELAASYIDDVEREQRAVERRRERRERAEEERRRREEERRRREELLREAEEQEAPDEDTEPDGGSEQESTEETP